MPIGRLTTNKLLLYKVECIFFTLKYHHRRTRSACYTKSSQILRKTKNSSVKYL